VNGVHAIWRLVWGMGGEGKGRGGACVTSLLGKELGKGSGST
jgi:hypothetical protein